MTPQVFLVTGANRGMGLAWVDTILATVPGSQVIATARKVASAAGTKDELCKLEHKYDGRVERVQMDIASTAYVWKLAQCGLLTMPLSGDGQSDLGSVQKAAEVCARLAIAKGGIDVVSCTLGFDGA